MGSRIDANEDNIKFLLEQVRKLADAGAMTMVEVRKNEQRLAELFREHECLEDKKPNREPHRCGGLDSSEIIYSRITDSWTMWADWKNAGFNGTDKVAHSVTRCPCCDWTPGGG